MHRESIPGSAIRVLPRHSREVFRAFRRGIISAKQHALRGRKFPGSGLRHVSGRGPFGAALQRDDESHAADRRDIAVAHVTEAAHEWLRGVYSEWEPLIVSHGAIKWPNGEVVCKWAAWRRLGG